MKKTKAHFIGATATVDCPVHHQPLVIQHKDGRIFAICNCDAPNNQYFGKTVWEDLTRPVSKEQGDK